MIRQATNDDLGALAALYKVLMISDHGLRPDKFVIPDDAECEKRIRKYLNTDSFFGVICHEDGGIIDGYASYLTITATSDAIKAGGFLVIANLVVAEGSRRKGIGTELLNRLFGLAKELHCATVTLDTLPENAAALSFYKKMGLVPSSIHLEKRIDI